MRLTEFQTVRIKALLREASAYDPSGDNERTPRVGDTGTIVGVPRRSGGQPYYTVECGRSDGTCAWVADFAEAELEAIEAEPEIAPERQSPRPVRQHDSGEAAQESVPSDGRLYAGVVAAVVLFAAAHGRGGGRTVPRMASRRRLRVPVCARRRSGWCSWALEVSGPVKVSARR